MKLLTIPLLAITFPITYSKSCKGGQELKINDKGDEENYECVDTNECTNYPDICNPKNYAGNLTISQCVNLDPDFKCICYPPYTNHPDYPASRCQLPSCPSGKRLKNEQNCQWVGRTYHTVKLDCTEACSDECNENETRECKAGQICRLNLDTNPVCECPIGTFFDETNEECTCAGKNQNLENGHCTCIDGSSLIDDECVLKPEIERVQEVEDNGSGFTDGSGVFIPDIQKIEKSQTEVVETTTVTIESAKQDDNTLFLVGIVVVFFIIAAVIFYFKKRSSKRNKEMTPGIEAS